MSSLDYYILFWVCIVGLCLGSFYNVVILRSLSNESIIFPPSKCPKCNNKLRWWHNIPILSYILLRGKCYFCKEKISIQYPIIEFITMLFFGFVYLKFGYTSLTLFSLLWISCLLIMTVTDLKEQLVDCNIAIIMGISGIVYNFINYGSQGLINSGIGLLLGLLILLLMSFVGKLIAKAEAMGEADIYVAAALGAVFGKEILLVLLASLIVSMIFIIPIFFYHQYKNSNKQTCILGIFFILSILTYERFYQNYYTLSLLVITGIWLAISICKSIGNVENRHYLPFVPALSIGALYIIFF